MNKWLWAIVSNPELKCDCGCFIMKSYDDGVTKLRSKVTFFDATGQCVAVCKGCGSEHPIPVVIQGSLTKPMTHYVLLDTKDDT